MGPRRGQTKTKKPEPEPESESESEASDEFESGSESESESDGSESGSEESSTSNDDDAGDVKPKQSSDVVADDNHQGFTDENSKWLKPKPKKQLLSDSDSEEGSSSEDEGASSDSETSILSIERESALLDAQLLTEQTESTSELLHTIATQSSTFHLPTPDQTAHETDGTRVVPPSELRERIDGILEVLGDFTRRREEGRARSDYVAQLAADYGELFGYIPELVSYLCTMFNPSEMLEFLEASDAPRPLVVRTNTLKARRKDLASALMKRGVTLDPLATWSKVGLKITASPVPIGATPEYLAGHYMLQSAASFCPCIALNPSVSAGKRREIVLDLSAAPGGKTSYLAQLMRNTGVVYANDLKPERQKSTVANMARLGVKNVIACHMDGRKIGVLWKNRFTKVLLDAPCSGLGVVSRDPSVKIQRTIKDLDRCQVLQKELILSAVDALDCRGKGPGPEKGGVLVYSTCSVSVKENEEVVDYLLNHRDVKIVEVEVLDFGRKGFTRYQGKRFHPSLSKTRRFYPHVHNMDGFYVAKIIKLSDRKPKDVVEGGEEMEEEEENEEVNAAGEMEVVETTTPKQDKEENWDARIKQQQASKKPVSANSKKPSHQKKRRGKHNGKKTQESSGSPEASTDMMRSKVAGRRDPSAEGNKKRRRTNNAKVNKPRRTKVQD